MNIEETIRNIYAKRTDWSHKGQMGKLLVVAGSEKYTGSPIFNAMSALKSGCDLVTVATPRRSADIIVIAHPDIITKPLEGNFLTKNHSADILSLAAEHDALLIGGGLGREKETFEAVAEIVRQCALPMVIDADGLRALAGRLYVLEGKKVIVTPHTDEFFALSGERVSDDESERETKVKRLARNYHMTVVLKGHVDIVAQGDAVYGNKTGSIFMTKGGFGDTLAGICGGLLARGIEPFEAACAATYLNGKTGSDVAKIEKEGALASELFEHLPQTIESILSPEPDVLKNVVILQKAILTRKDGMFLTLKRSSNSPGRPGKWDFPGGRLGSGENAIEGVKREIREETGITDVAVEPFTVENEYDKKTGRTWIIIGYKGCVAPQNNAIHLSHEHSEYQWVTKKIFLRLKSADYLKRFVQTDTALSHGIIL